MINELVLSREKNCVLLFSYFLYGKHGCFDLAFNSQKDKIRPLHYFFCLSLKGATIDHFSNDNIGAVKNEAILNCKDFEWSSFMCLLGLSSVLKGQVLSFYPDVGDFNHKHLFNCHITPRTSSINQKCFKILFCRNEPFGTFIKSAKFQSNHFVPLLTTIRKRKKNNPSHTRSASKKICLKLLEMESLASRFNKGYPIVMGHIVFSVCFSATKLLPERKNWCIFPILIGVMLSLSLSGI